MPSGINDTKAAVYVFVAGPHGWLLAITTEHLLRAVQYAAARDKRNEETEETDGSHPTKGVFIYYGDIQKTRDISIDEH